MRKLLCLLVLAAAPVGAAPKWLTAVPRAVGRTSKTMAMPWTDKRGAMRDYLIVGAVFADAATSHRALTGNPLARENSPLLPARPSAGVYWLTMAPLAIGEATLTTYSEEITKGGDPNKYWNAYAHMVPWITAAGFVIPHSLDAYENSKNTK